MELYRFDTLPSTNQILWELLDGGSEPPVAAIACQQTAGRGQWGRQWQSLRGGLYLSVALSPAIVAAAAPHLTLCTAWGIGTALRQYQIPVWLKWPNDLILEGRKLGGIKTETRVRQGIVAQAVVGVGINWANPVPPVGVALQPFLADRQPPPIPDLDSLAAIAIEGLLAGYQHYLSCGIDGLLPAYLDLWANRGQRVRVGDCPGVVVGVTERGELRVRLQSPGAAAEVALPPGSIRLGYC